MIKKRHLAIILLSVFTFSFLSSCDKKGNELISTAKIHSVGSQKKLTSLLKDAKTLEDKRNSDTLTDSTSMDVAMPGEPGESDNNSYGEEARDYVDTNEQVEGVKEADIIKTDGYKIYYAPRYHNIIRVVDVLNNYDVSLEQTINLKDVYVDAFYLLDNYLVVIGYRYVEISYSGETSPDHPGDQSPEEEDKDEVVNMRYMWYSPTGTILLINRDTLEIDYELTNDSYFIEHRLIDETLFLITHKHVSYDKNVLEQRPTYEVTIGSNKEKHFVDYSDLYYFDESPTYSINVVASLKILDDVTKMEFNVKGYLGSYASYKNLYVNRDNLYIMESIYHYGNNRSYTTSLISQHSLDVEKATTSYVASSFVIGGMLNQFSMDEYDGYLRLATTNRKWEWSNITNVSSSEVTNYLFILKVDESKYTFDLIGYIKEGLGKPNEEIKSVRFNEDVAYIVTFFNVDPLYVIDLSDPSKPTIVDEIFQLGYDLYQHPWGEGFLLGLGYDADENGIVTTMKLSAYKVVLGESEILQTSLLQTSNKVGPNTWSYNYSEGLYNHRALLVSVDKGYFGFSVNASEYGQESNGNYYFSYHAYYYLFKIDFSLDTPISEPIVIEHPNNDNDYYINVDRGVAIDNYLYTFSNKMVITYSFLNERISGEPLIF
ncbi:MAG: beta-propeller domain-containing protein [Bacilli bacterium]|jgi:uncharacterized secreted protein with C-terminal beta-propeller domain|nr:hypothetical protein [Erysipelotrichia bacterium]